MKRWIALVLTVTLLLCVCTACGSKPEDPASAQSVGSSSVGTETTSPSKPVQQLGGEDMQKLVKTRAEELGLSEAMLADGIATVGNHARVAAVIRKALSGQPVTLGVIGGSITEGTASSDAAHSYAGQLKTWWETLFPGAPVTLANAGKGATGSIIGAHRVQADLLDHNPDLVIMEYAVNDSIGERDQESYESLLRRIWQADSKPAVILLFTMKEDGTNAQKVQSKIGLHYDVPMLSYRSAVYPQIEKGTLAWKDISPDNIHPNDKGHAMIGVLLAQYLVNVYKQLDTIAADEPALPAPLVGNRYEGGVLYTNKNLQETSAGSFQRVLNAFYQFPFGWKAVGGGEAIEFTIPACRELYMMIPRLADENAGIAEVKVEGKTVQIKEFAQDYPGLTYQYADPLLLYKGENAVELKVSIRLKPQAQTDYFTLLGFLAS